MRKKDTFPSVTRWLRLCFCVGGRDATRSYNSLLLRLDDLFNLPDRSFECERLTGVVEQQWLQGGCF